MENNKKNRKIDRRGFLRTTAVTGAGLVMSPYVFGQTSQTESSIDDINIALLGTGKQGQVLMTSCMEIPGVCIKAVCDIWESYNQTTAHRVLSSLGFQNNAYTDYQEMLTKEKDLDAVIIATPDFWHSKHTVDCLEAGLHVYCEKEMSNTIEGAKAMVEAAKKTGKYLQIGHQRRSNPFYIYAYEKYIKETNLLNRITTINGQWNRSKFACEENPIVPKYSIPPEILHRYKFDSMQQFRNWRWYKDKGGGPIVDLGSHQIDVYSWFLGANPISVVADGGTDYWDGREWYDNVMAIYEYQTEKGSVRAFYQTITTNSGQGYFEQFMGDEGTLVISESAGRTKVYREEWVDEGKWDQWVKKGYLIPIQEEELPEDENANVSVVMDTRETPLPPSYDIPLIEGYDEPYHYAHLVNFFDTIRGKAQLNCPAEIGYETAVAVLKVNEAVEAERKLRFQPDEFTV